MNRPGSTLITYITLVDATNAPVEGAGFTVTQTLGPEGFTFPDAVTVTSQGNGLYKLTVQTHGTWHTGRYYVAVQADDVFASRFEASWDIVAGTMARTADSPARGLTRGELRQMIARQLGDYLRGEATHDGEPNAMRADRDFQREVNFFKGMQIVCVSGPDLNVGKTATVQGSDPVSKTITFAPSFPVATQVGDIVELFNMRGMGWTLEQYNAAINGAIAQAGEDHATVPYQTAAEERFNRRDPVIEIPAPLIYFEGLDLLDRQGVWRSVQPRYLWVDRFAHTVEIKGRQRDISEGQAIRIRGHARPQPLEHDEDRTSIQSEWLVIEASAILLQHDVASGMSQGARDRLMFMARQGADGRRPIVGVRYGPNTVKLA